VASSLTRVQVCNLLRFWASPAHSLSGLSPSELNIIFYCPNLEGQVPIFMSLRTGWPSYTPGHWVPFSSPLTTRRATGRYSNRPPHGVNC
jgi:hypothetical protein